MLFHLGLMKRFSTWVIKIRFIFDIWRRHGYQDWLYQAEVIGKIWAWSIWTFLKALPIRLKSGKAYPFLRFQDIWNISKECIKEADGKEICVWCSECLRNIWFQFPLVWVLHWSWLEISFLIQDPNWVLYSNCYPFNSK